MTKRITIVGGGFAGVFAALGAAAEIRQQNSVERVAVDLVSPVDFFTIRPRLYEADLRGVRMRLSDLLAPVGVRWRPGRVIALDGSSGVIELLADGGRRDCWSVDALVLACGSFTRTPSAWNAIHNVDTWEGALGLQRHLEFLDAGTEPDEFVRSAIVIGAGFTGLETATELVARLGGLRPHRSAPVQVVLIERSGRVGSDYGPRAQAYIEAALSALGIRCLLGSEVVDVNAQGTVTLADGNELRTGTTVWTGGPRAQAILSDLRASAAGLGRLDVDEFLRTPGSDRVFAAGDIAGAEALSGQLAPMSCQHAIPQGKVAGHNAVRTLLGLELNAYQQPRYITCLDLAGAGALLTSGFERDNVIAVGEKAKAVKRMINRGAIYPPVDGQASSLVDAGRVDQPPSATEAADDEGWARALLRLAASRQVPDRAAEISAETTPLEMGRT
jgi:NADH:quinone reductase (non-electrogenic)